MVAPTDGNAVPLAGNERVAGLGPDAGTGHFHPDRCPVGDIRIDHETQLIEFGKFFFGQIQWQTDLVKGRILSVDVGEPVTVDTAVIQIELQNDSLIRIALNGGEQLRIAGLPTGGGKNVPRKCFGCGDVFRFRRDDFRGG